MWKVGSEAHLLPPLPRDPLDPLDPVDPVDPLDPVDPVENSETSIFDNPSVDFGHFACGAPPGNAPTPLGALGELWEALGELWEGLRELWECFGRAFAMARQHRGHVD